MHAVFIELPPFERHRETFLDDDAFRRLQAMLVMHPEAGDVIPGAGGLRKLRYVDERRHKGKRGGLRVIYYYWLGGAQFLLFTLYDKDKQDDLTGAQRRQLGQLLAFELKARQSNDAGCIR